MNDSLVGEACSLESLVGRLADEFLRRQEAGERPDVEEYVARHPQAADLLRKVLASLQLLQASLTGSGPRAADSGDEPAGTLGDFRLGRELGRGGMGIVYEAEQISLGRRVALKVLPFAATMDSRHLQRFQNEARAAAGLHHTNIVPVYAVGVERGVHYYAMQLIEGRTLADFIAEQCGAAPPQPPAAESGAPTVPPAAQATSAAPRDAAYFRQVAEWGIQAAEALDCAHELGVLHRDVKPGNLMVDAAGRLWVADFGLARVQSDTRLTMTGDVVGTLRYMSPEQALAKRVVIDHRTDVYSLGATLYELLALRPAYTGDDREELLRQITFEEPARPRGANKAVPAELETVVLKAMEKDPADRYATAQALADDLRRYLMYEPIRASRPSLVKRARKIARRHPGVAVTAAIAVFAGLLLGVAGLAVNNWMVRREQVKTRDALDRAEREKAIAEAVRLFLQDKLLLQADPRAQGDALRRAGGSPAEAKPNPTIRDLLDRAARELTPERIEGQFPGQPLVQAVILKTVGEAYGGIGDYDPAISHLQRARELQTRELGPDHSDTLKTTQSLARAYLDGGKVREAAGLLEWVRDRRSETLSSGHPDTLASMNDLERCYYRLGQPQKVLGTREDIVRLRKASLGPDHRDTLESMNNLANSYAAVDRLHDAQQLHQETLGRRKRTLGEDDPDTLQSMNNVANCHAALDQYPDALRLHQETLERRRTRLGPDHPDTLQSMNNVAVALSALGRHAEARKLHEETLELRMGKLHRDHRDTIQSMNALAWILANCPDRTLRDPAKALERARQAVELAPGKGEYRNTLGTAYYRVGDWKNTVDTLTVSMQLRKGGDAADWFFLAMAHWHLADEKDKGRGWYDRAVQWMEKHQPQDKDLRQFRAEAAGLLGIEKE
jgi:serine/threonine protein kinase